MKIIGLTKTVRDGNTPSTGQSDNNTIIKNLKLPPQRIMEINFLLILHFVKCHLHVPGSLRGPIFLPILLVVDYIPCIISQDVAVEVFFQIVLPAHHPNKSVYSAMHVQPSLDSHRIVASPRPFC
ncbi:hypothetical protein EBI_25529 [Enterocytozoon bieneusi H348]|nr:hypothetical protein EBI_25529 [Enterocytozoon bieneusi H348]|eukprot:XP_002651135.1 hypothetical protein EBI_25529 [Enterocytozoon bieneusi H348]